MVLVSSNIAILPGNHVLLLWGGAGNSPEAVKDVVTVLTERVGPTGKVQVENIDRLLLSGHGTSSFDIALVGYVPPVSVTPSSEVLAELARMLKPSGCLCIREPTIALQNSTQIRTSEKLVGAIKLSGFVDITQPAAVILSPEEQAATQNAVGSSEVVSVLEVQAKKPAYEVGASSQLKLSFASKPAPKVDATAAQVWSLSANDMMDDDIEIMDSDDLLDEDDLKKPDPESLKVVCGDGTKRKKACKDCSCGLAEELETEAGGKAKPAQKSATSACGSCYLGDAFRCASCPYLGMPAFKPGEKVALSTRQLNVDQ